MKRTISVILTAVMLSAVLGAPLPASARADEPALPFRDVSEGDWFFEAVAYVYEHGIMVGVTADTFSVSSATTRAQLVTVLSRLDNADVDGMRNEHGFTDVENGEWYADAVGWASSRGIVNGYTDGTFRPEAPVLRQELCAML
ncbi:MAG: S-layer homology domain-containing protein, partial [Clostridia bacterium]|nr:S-layer homology domain-containing protein [Clostridia bacterium]